MQYWSPPSTQPQYGPSPPLLSQPIQPQFRPATSSRSPTSTQPYGTQHGTQYGTLSPSTLSPPYRPSIQKVSLVPAVQKVISPPQIPYPQVHGPTYQANIDPNCLSNTLQNVYNAQMNPMNLMYNYPLHLSSTSDLDTMSSRDIIRRKKLKALYAEYRKIKHDVVSESDAKYSEYRKRKHELKKKIKKYES